MFRRNAFGMILTLGFGLAMGYFATENQTLVPINLGLLLPGQQPQLHVWEIALFPALVALFTTLFWSLGGGGGQTARLTRALKETQNELRVQREQLAALENQLRAGGFVPLASLNAVTATTGATISEIPNDAADAAHPLSSANG